MYVLTMVIYLTIEAYDFLIKYAESINRLSSYHIILIYK